MLWGYWKPGEEWENSEDLGGKEGEKEKAKEEINGIIFLCPSDHCVSLDLIPTPSLVCNSQQSISGAAVGSWI